MQHIDGMTVTAEWRGTPEAWWWVWRLDGRQIHAGLANQQFVGAAWYKLENGRWRSFEPKTPLCWACGAASEKTDSFGRDWCMPCWAECRAEHADHIADALKDEAMLKARRDNER